MARADYQTGPRVFLSLGYLFVAIIILINYLNKDKPDGRLRNPLSSGVAMASPEMESLKNRLLEEQKLNAEMKEMLAKFRIAFRTGHMPSSSNANAKSEILPSLDDILKNGLPKIRPDFFEDLPEPETPPFQSEKNPFLPFFRSVPGQSVMHTLPRSQDVVFQSHPKIPFLLQSHWSPTEVLEGR